MMQTPLQTAYDSKVIGFHGESRISQNVTFYGRSQHHK